MAKNISMYREASETAIVYHNKNELPGINIPHLHSQYEIYYNISGADGFFFDKKYYSCDGNDLFIVPKVCVHKALIKPNTIYERCIISIAPQIISAINEMPGLKNSLSWLDQVGELITGKVNLNPKEHMSFMNLAYKYNNCEDSLKKLAILLEIISFISLKFKSTAPIRVSAPNSTLGMALLIIEENFRDIKVSDISKKLFISNSHFSKMFTEQCGVTPIRYILLRKVAEAKKFLYMGMSVKEACFLSGFSDYSNFVRTFKNIEGCSPGKFEHLSEPL